MSKIEQLRESILKQKPTPEQIRAIFTDELEFILRAAPGSGKTWTSCRRFIWRGANWPYKAGGLALLSFTNTAVREFQQATISIGRRELLLDPNYAGTFDKFVERFIISPFGHLITKSDKRPRLFLKELPGQRNNWNIIVQDQKNNGKPWPIPAWEIVPSRSKEGKTIYNREGKELNASDSQRAIKNFLSMGYYTHNQRVFWAAYLLHKRPHIANVIARRFPEIIVDEAQDCNIWLLIILDQLRNQGSKITLVGDPDQCIYDFSMADSGSLQNLREKWELPEKPLSKSFRFNDIIAGSVSIVGGNNSISGRGESQSIHRAYVISDDTPNFSQSIASFEKYLDLSHIERLNSAILCRGHNQLESLRGRANYAKMTGLSKGLAEAASLRDRKKSYDKAYQLVEGAVRTLIPDEDFWELVDENPDSMETKKIQVLIWKFMKSSDRLPPINQHGAFWVEKLRSNVQILLRELGFSELPKINQRIQKRPKDQMQIPLFELQDAFTNIRHDTIHQVKGESIDGVLVIGSKSFWDKVVKAIQNNESPEERRIAYVAMTRARNLLFVGLPSQHYKKHLNTWRQWGFSEISF